MLNLTCKSSIHSIIPIHSIILRLTDMGRHVGYRMVDVFCWRERAPKRETRVVHVLWYIQKTVWKVSDVHYKYVSV